MKPKVILHNSVSLDGSFLNFDVNLGLHYQIASGFHPDAHLIGSTTAKTGLEVYGGELAEEEKDFRKPNKDERLPYWVVVDTRGILKGLLHAYRRFEFCRDVIVLVSKKTPGDYIDYLKAREYGFYVAGDDHVDFRKAFDLLEEGHQIKTILTDTGRVLGNILLNEGLVDEISLLVHPTIVGKKSENLFKQVNSEQSLRIVKREVPQEDYLWMLYEVEKHSH